MKILYATDGSEGARSAGRFLAGLPCRPDTIVHIVTAAEPQKEGEGNAVLEEARRALDSFPGKITTAIVPGGSTHRIADAVLKVAASLPADMIVVGASGHSGLSRFLLGSVAETIVRHARTPALIVRPLAGRLEQVLIGVDGSSLSEDAATWLTETFPLPPKCILDLVRVASIPPWLSYPDIAGAGLHAELTAQAIADEERAAKSHVQELAARLTESARERCCSVETEVTVGYPADELVRLAKERDAGLIVVGSHGRRGLEHVLVGSVSERVMRHAPCSVLIIHHAHPA
jgi:nucleotide-binding universal stress UspA family protein